MMANDSNDLTEDVCNGWRILRENKLPGLLQTYYAMYNKQCFDGSLPFVVVIWAERITQPDVTPANAIYVPGDAVLRRRYIAIDGLLSGMFPLERLCLLHEMIARQTRPRVGPWRRLRCGVQAGA